MNDSNSGKLYFLKDRGRRPAPRLPRKRPDSAATAERHRPSPQETLWLARALFVQAVYLILYWGASGMELSSTDADSPARLWTLSSLLPDVFVAVVASLGSYDLAWRPGKRD